MNYFVSLACIVLGMIFMFASQAAEPLYFYQLLSALFLAGGMGIYIALKASRA